MNTDAEVEAIKRIERKKVFWVLNTLPWVLVSITFSIIVFLIYLVAKYVPNTPPFSNTKIMTSNVVENIDNRLEFEIEAVSNKMGEWSIDSRGNRSFHWLNKVDKIEIRDIQYTNNVIEVVGREYPFTVRDMQLAKDINLDIEKQMVNNCLDVLDDDFAGQTSNESKELKKRLAIDLTKGIKRVFDGFESWNRENRK